MKIWFRTRKLRPSRKGALLGFILSVLIAASVGVAAWQLTNAQVNYRGKVGTAVALTSNTNNGDAAQVTSPLVPGSTGDLVVKLSNPNAAPVTLTLPGSLPGLSNDKVGSGCANTNFTTATSGMTFTPATVPANAVDVIVHLNNAVSLSSSAPTSCQDAVISVNNISLTGTIGS